LHDQLLITDAAVMCTYMGGTTSDTTSTIATYFLDPIGLFTELGQGDLGRARTQQRPSTLARQQLEPWGRQGSEGYGQMKSLMEESNTKTWHTRAMQVFMR
jgi:hypothetical protein